MNVLFLPVLSVPFLQNRHPCSAATRRYCSRSQGDPWGEGGSDMSFRLVLQYFFPTCWGSGDDLGNLLT